MDANRLPPINARLCRTSAAVAGASALLFVGACALLWLLPQFTETYSFHVFTDWESRKHVDDEERSFAKLWNDRKRSCRVVELPEALKADLLRFLPSFWAGIAAPAFVLALMVVLPFAGRRLPGRALWFARERWKTHLLLSKTWNKGWRSHSSRAT